MAKMDCIWDGWGERKRENKNRVNRAQGGEVEKTSFALIASFNDLLQLLFH